MARSIVATTCVSLGVIAAAVQALPVVVPMSNAADPGMMYPTMGLGTAGGWGWQPIGDGDVLALEAATLAVYGAKRTKPSGRVPRRIY